MLQLSNIPWRRYAVYGFTGLMTIGGGAFLYQRFRPDPPAPTVPVALTETPQAVKVEKVYVPGPIRWRVYKKKELAQKVPLSPANVANPKVEYTASSVIPPSPYGGVASSFTNISSGISDIEYAPSKRPLFGFGGKTNIGAFGGMSTKGNIAMLYAHQPIVRVGPVNLGVAAGVGIVGSDGLVGGVVSLSGEF